MGEGVRGRGVSIREGERVCCVGEGVHEIEEKV